MFLPKTQVCLENMRSVIYNSRTEQSFFYPHSPPLSIRLRWDSSFLTSTHTPANIEGGERERDTEGGSKREITPTFFALSIFST